MYEENEVASLLKSSLIYLRKRKGELRKIHVRLPSVRPFDGNEIAELNSYIQYKNN